jgi:hypothetical protein
VAVRSDGIAVSWGRNDRMQCNVPPLPACTEYVQLSGGGFHALLRRSDGIVVALGLNNEGQCNVPPGRFAEVAAGYLFSLGRRADGTVVAWGSNFVGQGNVPPLPPGMQYIQIEASDTFAAALRSDGAVVAWGSLRQVWFPPPGERYRYVKLAIENYGLVALHSDGGIETLYQNGSYPRPLPPGMRYVDVTGGSQHFLARRSDGIVVAWGVNDRGQCNVPPLPPGMSYVEVTAGRAHSVARRSDGTVLVWGDDTYLQHRISPLAPGTTMTRIDAGDHFTLALFASGVANWSGEGCGVKTIPLVGETSPRIGQPFTVRIGIEPNWPTLLLTGASNLVSSLGPLPLDLSPVGATGCTLRVSPDLALPVDPQTGRATLHVPNDPALVAALFYQQTLMAVPGVNRAGLLLSNALTVLIGN